MKTPVIPLAGIIMHTSRFVSLGSWLGIWLAFLPVTAGEFHVAPDGTEAGNGSALQPWDLATALAAPESVRPGDTIWLQAGTYRGGFVSQLVGQPGMPIVVRAARGGRVTIDTHPHDERDNGLFAIRGADTIYRDFELTCSHEKRRTEIPQSWPADIRRGSVDVRGDRISLLNLVVHDQAQGFSFWSEGEGGEISGCLIYYCGWRGPDRGHGHGIYTQNARGTKRIADNILFHQFGYGIHAYGSEKASLKGFDIEGNIAFDNGCLADPSDRAPGIMVGGGTPAERIAVRDNVVVGSGIRLGYPWGTTNEDVVCTGNYCQGIVVRDFRRGTISKNTVVAESNVAQIEAAEDLMLADLKWNQNDYYVTDGRWGEFAIVEHGKSRGMTFGDWKLATGFDAASAFTKGPTTKLRVMVRPNRHEQGRANIAVLNPAGLAEVQVDLSSVLDRGQAFRIVSAKDFFGAPLVSGTYNGQPVRLPMKPIQGPQPVGMPEVKLPVTEPQFGAYVVMASGS
jgi:hypothetical protein